MSAIHLDGYDNLLIKTPISKFRYRGQEFHLDGSTRKFHFNYGLAPILSVSLRKTVGSRFNHLLNNIITNFNCQIMLFSPEIYNF